jgi:AcrR family transcriptional regulator
MTDAATEPTPPPTKSERERIIDAFMVLLGEASMEEIGMGQIAARADVSLAELRQHFGGKLAILAAYMKEVDRAVLGGIAADMAAEPPRERLFDVLMRRLDVLAPNKAAVRSLRRSAARNPGLTVALNGLSARSAQWMLTAADIPATGPLGALRAQGLAMLFATVVGTWLNDDDPGLARTMSALDRALSRGATFAGLLDNLERIPQRLCRARPRRRDAKDETVAA